MRWLALLLIPLVGCPEMAPPNRPEETCQTSCASKTRCREAECVRGCRFILDRLIEREGDRVLACVARSNACDDPSWAHCAVRVGPHLDGGPPAPPPATEEE